MKILSLGVLCVFCFVLGTLVPVTHTHAQQNTPQQQTYYVIDYMKTYPGQDSLKMEQTLWKPFHQESLKAGDIKSWAVMQPVLAGPHNYDYITVTGYSSLEAYAKLNQAGFTARAEKVWGKDKMQGAFDQTDKTRDMLGSEMFVVLDSVASGK
jgi:hypothetical protein